MNETVSAEDLHVALQELTQNLGVWREDLLADLQGKLAPLQKVWSVNLNNGIDVARATVEANLNAHIARLPPQSPTEGRTLSQQQDRYLLALNVNFNLVPGLERKEVMARRASQARHPNKVLRMSASTSGRYLKSAIENIADQILAAGFMPTEANLNHQVEEAGLEAVEQTAPLAESSTPEVAPVKRRYGRRQMALTVAAVLVAAGGITYAVNQSGESSAQGKGVATTPSLGTSSGGIQTGNYLSMSDAEMYLSSLDTSASAVFPTSALAAAPHGIFTQSKMPGEIPAEHQLSADEMAAGGYLLGGAILTTDVRAVGSAQVIIHNIRVVNFKRLPIVTGKAFIIFPQGAANEAIRFMLDKAMPTGDALDGNTDTGLPWSTTRHSTVTAGTPDTMTLVFVALRYAYTFNVAFDYEVNGKNYTQLINNDAGKPLLMRVSASLCPPSDFKSQLSSADMAKLEGLRYSGIHANLMTNFYSVADVDPKLYSPNGIACPSYPQNKTGQGK